MEFIFGISGILVGTVIMIGFIIGVFEIIETHEYTDIIPNVFIMGYKPIKEYRAWFNIIVYIASIIFILIFRVGFYAGVYTSKAVLYLNNKMKIYITFLFKIPIKNTEKDKHG